MIKTICLLLASAVIFLSGVTPCGSQNILVWKHDGKASFTDPEGKKTVACEYGIKKALTDNGYAYTDLTVLPEDLSSFDIIFITLGFALDCG